MSQLFTPVPAVHPPPGDEITARYLRSYLILRVVIGALGLALPFLLVLFGGRVLSSLSSYYYSGARELFVGALCAVGVFLITYKVAELNLDNTLSVLAGSAVLLVAGFPTTRPSDRIPLTPLQERLGETAVATVHFAAAGVFIVALAVISYSFGKREGEREPVPGKRPPRFWRAFHWACAAVILAAGVWSLVTELTGWGPRRSLLYGEVAALWAFGVSWLWKGLELDLLKSWPAQLEERDRPRVAAGA